MREVVRKKWHKFLNPVYTPAVSLMYWSVLLFFHHYYHRGSSIHTMFHRDDSLRLLLYGYAPIVLLYNFVRIPPGLAGFASMIAFVCTVSGIVFFEVALMRGVRRPDIFDFVFQVFFLIQAVVLTYRLLFYMRSIQTIFSAPKEMQLEPDPLLALLVLVFVPSLALAGDHLLGLRADQNANLVAVAGLLLIYLLGLRPAKVKPL